MVGFLFVNDMKRVVSQLEFCTLDKSTLWLPVQFKFSKSEVKAFKKYISETYNKVQTLMIKLLNKLVD